MGRWYVWAPMSTRATSAIATATRPPHRVDAAAGRDFRPEIQGLRAVAVGLVVLTHLWPARLHGGYVGVDVFFVISGYLITSHLMREVTATGTVDVPAFWARRIRRLLPASFVVLLLSGVAMLLLAPRTVWTTTTRQVAASALYAQNWVLQWDAVDYMAKDNDPTVAQHYWSLSVEEQFYLVWPLIVVGALWLLRRRLNDWEIDLRTDLPVRRRRAGPARGVVTAAIGAIGLASLTTSVLMTADDRARAYFITFTRAWEFAAGALVALIAVTVSGRLRSALGWAGLGAIVASAVMFDERSAFPGWIALLPVLGTAAVIVATDSTDSTHSAHSDRRRRRSIAWWLARRPATFLGDVSYAVYLWHWPLIALTPYLTGHRLRWPEKLAIVAATLVLAWISTTWIERPMRTGPLLASATWRAFVFALAGMVAIGGLHWGVTRLVGRQEDQARRAGEQVAARMAGCLGPRSLEPGRTCVPVEGTGPLLVPAESLVRQGYSEILQNCQQAIISPGLKTCVLGTTTGAERTVALLGDSHAAQWTPMFDEIGKQLRWKIVVHVKGSCPMSLARRVLPGERGDTRQLACEAFNRAGMDDIAAHPEITDVFVAAMPGAYRWTQAPGVPLANPAVDGYTAAWNRLTAAGARLHVIAGTPRTRGSNVPTCLARHPDDVLACSVRRADALPADEQRQVAERWKGRPSVIDLTDQLCDATWCYARIGSVAVHRDGNHLTLEYARMLAPYAIAQLPASLRLG